MDTVSIDRLLPPESVYSDPDVVSSLLSAEDALSSLRRAAESSGNIGILTEASVVLEACASCAIERIVATPEDVFDALSSGMAEGPVAGILGCREAILFSEDREPDIGTLEAVCSRVKGTPMRIRGPGEQVHLVDPADGSVVHTPPPGEDVAGLLAQLIGYTRDDNIDPLLRMAVSHAAFEGIHPFMDGNGRTGRVLNGMLLGSGFRPPVSAAILEGDRDYRRLLGRVQRRGSESDWSAWTVFMLGCLEDASARAEAWIRRCEGERDARSCIGIGF